jgi:hypothetical protein
VCNVYFYKAYESARITNSQPHVRAIIVFMCVKNICACNKLHYGKVRLAVMTSPSYFVTTSLIGYLNMTHFIHHSTREKRNTMTRLQYHVLIGRRRPHAKIMRYIDDEGWEFPARNHK